ncbi:MAG TPA: hypothetical protein VFV95_15580 [Vicinamibacterales bacterium]|nr:hypothetical protein [Vicinamibacterales bacterium]
MRRRTLVTSGIAATSVFVAILALPLQGQSPSQSAIGAGAPALVITAYNGGQPIAYTVPRTPWGDPDLQGTWSSDDATMPVGARGGGGGRPGGPPPGAAPAGGAPPAAAAASAAPPPLYLTDEEFKARQKQIADGVEQAEERAESSFRGDFARRAFKQSRLLVDPPDGIQPQPTAEARKRAAPRDQGTFGNGPFNSVEDFTLYDRCITRGIWGSIQRVIYGNGNRIVQAPGMVAISYEMIHDTRVIYTDGRPHIGSPIRQYLGDSRGRWEGDTLVVETTNLTDKTSIGPNGNGLRHSDRMKMVERIKRVAPDIIQYQLTVDDPVTYPRPFTISLPLTPLDGGSLLPYDCHEGNLAVRQSLGAERAEDAAHAADLAKGIKRERRPVQDGLDVGGRPTGPRGGGPGGGPAGGRGGN